MKARNSRPGKRTDMKSRRKVLSIILLLLLLFTISASVAEAAALDKVKAAWDKMKVYVTKGAFWINTIIIFAVALVLYTLLLSNKVGSDTSLKVIMYILLIIVACIIATKIIDSSGTPIYMWHNQQFNKFTRFLIGPSSHTPTTECQGSGSYFTVVRGEAVCRQAILRTNNNGAGLPALLIGLILFYLVFNIYGSKLGFDSSGGGGGKWLPIVLSIVLAAMVSNQGMTKNNLIMVAGWITVVLIGSKLGKSFAGEGSQGPSPETHSKRGFAFGIAFAFVQLIANLLGASLFGGEISASDIGMWSIIKNIGLGLIFGVIYSIFVGDRIFGRIMDKLNNEQREDVAQRINDGQYTKPFLRNIPIVGKWLYGSDRQQDGRREREARINRELEWLSRVYEQENRRENPDRLRIERIYRRMERLLDELRQLENDDTQNIERRTAPGGPEIPERPAQPEERGPPEMPTV